jgi:hypothetical protein
MSTTEEPQKLYAARKRVFPEPQMDHHDRHLGHLLPHALDPLGPRPGLPDQAVLIDLANRRFFFFWIEIWPHEFYFVAGL